MDNRGREYNQQRNKCEIRNGICDNDEVIIIKYEKPNEDKKCLDKQVLLKYNLCIA